MSKNSWMDKHSLGSLASTTNDYPKETVKIEKHYGLPVDKRRLLETYTCGDMTLEEFQIELSILNSSEK